MCLFADKQKTLEMKKQKGPVTVWKVYGVDKAAPNLLLSPIYTRTRAVKSNLVISDRVSGLAGYDNHDEASHYRYPDCMQINRGIHVFLTRKAAREFKKVFDRKSKYNSSIKYVIVKCETDMEHFVAVGHTCYGTWLIEYQDAAVFMGVYISPENWEKALKGDFR
ncbi:MAG TPA: hypothetical protein VMX17_02025 [Candidatus Glassbacteria bacterium]|nr:hypothetical protein [Candidatus Glassbacteria bacterium]